MVYTYAYRILQSVWRRKTTILLVISLLILLAIGLEYNRSGRFLSNSNTDNNSKKLSKVEMKSLIYNSDTSSEFNKNNVKFIESLKLFSNDRKLPQDTDQLDLIDAATIAKLEQPTREEIAYNRMLRINEEKSFLNRNENDDRKLLKPYIPNKRLVHFDLKGAPPKVNYLKRIFPLIKNMGATGILMEYEDMFPFTGSLSDIAAGNAYTKKEVQEILQAAKESKLDVIPLVQTFGHVEFILKHKKFIPLREIPDSPQALCPSRNQSLDLIREMITQVMALHPNVKYLHVGCDEVFQMGECEKCREVIRETLFLQHIKNVVNIVNEQWPHLKIIIWDDMLRHIPERTLDEMKIGELVQPMVWVYVEQIYHFVQMQVWEKYAAIFPTVWAASAYKGAFGETLFIPNAKRHLMNNLRWLELMDDQSRNFKKGFEGIVLTGWQRYDHFAVLCELLPAALPSLALSLIAVSNGYFNQSLRAPLLSSLSCPQYQSASTNRPFISLDTDPYLWDKFSRCMFPGSPFFKLTYRLDAAETEINEFVNSITKQKGWMTSYNVKYNYTLPLRVDELMSEYPRVYHTISSLARNAHDAMNDVYDIYTIAEWVEQRLYPYIKLLETIQSQSVALKQRKTWAKRPLQPLKELEKYGVPIETVG